MNQNQTTPLRLAARLSILAAFTCFTVNCVASRLLVAVQNHARWIDLAIGSATTGMVLAGIVLGVAGIVGGTRAKDSDTVIIAAIGLTMNLGIMAVMVLILGQLWSRPVASLCGL